MLTDVPEGADYSFGANVKLISSRMVLVSSSDSALLTKIKGDIAPTLDSSLMIEQEGNSLIVSSAHIFDSTTITDLNDPDGWKCGYVPAGGDVFVSGAGVKAIITEAITQYSSITIIDSAALQVEVDCSLPQLYMMSSGQLVVTNDAVLELAGTPICEVASYGELPLITIANGAKLLVPADARFSNVGINLFGELESSGVGMLTFGYAATGETTFFAMSGSGGKITMPSSGSYNVCLLRVACPAVGGRVVIPEPIVWASMTMPSVNWQKLYGFRCGVNNPTDQPFTLIMDNTKLRRGSHAVIEGAATLCLTNNAVFDCEENDGMAHHLQIGQHGQIVVHESASLLHLIANGGNTPMGVNPDSEDFPALVLKGGTARIFETSGNGNGVFVGNGVYEIYRDSDSKVVPRPFSGFSKVEISEGEKLTIRSVEMNTKLDKSVVMADVPLCGGGSMAVTNATPRGFVLTVVSGNNTALGTISACENSRVLFNDGANWAGKVVAEGNFGLTNTSEESVYASVSFAGLELAGDFPLRVGADGSDKLNLGSEGFSGSGSLVVAGEDGYDFKGAGKSILIGSVAKTAATLPKCAAGGMVIRLKEDPEDETRYNLWLTYGGTLVIVR